LKEQGRGLVGEGRFGLGNALVVVQVALSLILIVGAGLFMRTFSSLANLDLGFNRDPVLVASVNAQRRSSSPRCGHRCTHGCATLPRRCRASQAWRCLRSLR
jgi:hypothetical protein